MNAAQVIENAARTFDTPALAILARCEQSGLHLRMEGEHLKAKGNREVIEAWQPMIQRHKPEVIAALIGENADADFVDTLAADSEELTASIMELCQLAGYSDEARDRMLAARHNLYPFQIATEAAYFRWQVIRVREGAYWDSDVLRAGI
jgi:alpha-ketoglutarate-dependent taurine dioxygenase